MYIFVLLLNMANHPKLEPPIWVHENLTLGFTVSTHLDRENFESNLSVHKIRGYHEHRDPHQELQNEHLLIMPEGIYFHLRPELDPKGIFMPALRHIRLRLILKFLMRVFSLYPLISGRLKLVKSTKISVQVCPPTIIPMHPSVHNHIQLFISHAPCFDFNQQ